ncbi:hypothetical protein AKJ08_1175 [Vulgatibacter incomptus]|uniref:Uncharacterized protein n=2 Tax=Vulgatibacter incomptus TaxID=1391653 RepID=A0A0K1PB78_9BACT|nr:hypothetical protein AKJ08_1175 [Vulgatibacter incomptus]
MASCAEEGSDIVRAGCSGACSIGVYTKEQIACATRAACTDVSSCFPQASEE